MIRAINGIKISRCIVTGDLIIDEYGYLYTNRLCEYEDMFFLNESDAIGKITNNRISIFFGCLYEKRMIELCGKNVFRLFEAGPSNCTLPHEFYQSHFTFKVNDNEYYWHNYSKNNERKDYIINEKNELELLHE